MEQEKNNCWYAIRTFNCKEVKISNYLAERGLPNFVPMTYSQRFIEGKEKPQKILVPVVHNYLFLQKIQSESTILQVLQECPIPMSIIKERDTNKFCEISESEMAEFRLLCDPQFDSSIFVDSEEIEAKPGREVMIIHGPFKGVSGKLCRVRNNYYFIKAFVGIGVMVRISRWYCQVKP